VQQGRNDPEASLIDDVTEGVGDAVLDKVDPEGCLLGPVIWLVTLPFRLIWRIIEGIFD